jgi:hypothetical protein
MPVISDKDKASLLAEALDPKKVTLTCGLHNFAYGGSIPPNFKCKRCIFTLFFGLVANTPPGDRKELMDMLEAEVHSMIEMSKSGDTKMQDFFKHPEVYVNDKRIGVPKVN